MPYPYPTCDAKVIRWYDRLIAKLGGPEWSYCGRRDVHMHHGNPWDWRCPKHAQPLPVQSNPERKTTT